MHECLSDACCSKERITFGLLVYNNDTSSLPFALQAQVLSLDCVKDSGQLLGQGEAAKFQNGVRTR